MKRIMVRLFVAIDLPEEIREQFYSLREPLRSSRARLTMVEPGLLHITLKFIGEIEGSRVDQIISALADIWENPFQIELGLITTNSQKNPRVIWGETHDQGECKRLAGAIERALIPLGIPAESRAFRSHITIARVRQFHSSLFEAVAAIASECSGTIQVNEFILKKSELTPDGPIYSDLQTFRLRGQQ